MSDDVFATIAAEAERESPLWGGALRPSAQREREPRFSQLAPADFELAIETIYEGYLLHYGRSRLFDPREPDVAILLGDYLYAHGLVRLAAAGNVVAVHDLAELISLCARLRAERLAGDGTLWAATAALIGSGDPRLEAARAMLRLEVDLAAPAALARELVALPLLCGLLDAHAARLG